MAVARRKSSAEGNSLLKPAISQPQNTTPHRPALMPARMDALNAGQVEFSSPAQWQGKAGAWLKPARLKVTAWLSRCRLAKRW